MSLQAKYATVLSLDELRMLIDRRAAETVDPERDRNAANENV